MQEQTEVNKSDNYEKKSKASKRDFFQQNLLNADIGK